MHTTSLLRKAAPSVLGALIVMGGLWWMLHDYYRQAAAAKQLPEVTVAGTPKVNQPYAAKVVQRTFSERPTDVVLFGTGSEPVKLYLYSDLECPYCRVLYNTMVTVMPAYTGKVAVVYRHVPVASHPASRMEQEVASCVAFENKELAKALISETFATTISSGNSFTPAAYRALALGVGASATALDACLAAGKGQKAIDADVAEAISLNVVVTPTWYIAKDASQEATFFTGAVDEFFLKQALDASL